MIWHFAEVWLLFVMTFIVGCVLGAFLYGVLADSRYAVAQGNLADGVGDVVDQIKVRFGLGPAWRPKQMRSVARSSTPPAPPATPIEEAEPPKTETPAMFEEEAERLAPPPEALRLEPLPVQRALPPPAQAKLARQQALPRQKPPAPVDEPVSPGDPMRVASAMLVGRDGVVPKRPAGLASPRAGVPDNLTRIKGIGQRNEELLNSLGIFHFGQIASWTPAEARWIGQYLAFPERIDRDDWIGQATLLASGVDTGFEKSSDRRRRHRRELQELASRRAAAIAHNATEDEIVPGAPTGDFSDQVRAARPRPANDTPVEEEHSVEEMAAMDENMADEPASPDTYDDVDQSDEPARNEEDEERN